MRSRTPRVSGTRTPRASTAASPPRPTRANPGLISDLPNFSWGVLLPDEMKPGDYRIGIACSLFNETTRYWDTSYTIVADSSDEPAQFRWTASLRRRDVRLVIDLPDRRPARWSGPPPARGGAPPPLGIRTRTPRPSPSKERQS